MKNDTTTTLLNFVLAALVILGVVFALLTMWRMSDLRRLQPELQVRLQQAQIVTGRAQALLQETINYNATANNPELAQIIKSALPQQQTPAK